MDQYDGSLYMCLKKQDSDQFQPFYVIKGNFLSEKNNNKGGSKLDLGEFLSNINYKVLATEREEFTERDKEIYSNDDIEFNNEEKGGATKDEIIYRQNTKNSALPEDYLRYFNNKYKKNLK